MVLLCLPCMIDVCIDFLYALFMFMDLSLVMDYRELTWDLEDDMKIVQPQAVQEQGEKTKNGICLTDARLPSTLNNKCRFFDRSDFTHLMK